MHSNILLLKVSKQAVMLEAAGNNVVLPLPNPAALDWESQSDLLYGLYPLGPQH